MAPRTGRPRTGGELEAIVCMNSEHVTAKGQAATDASPHRGVAQSGSATAWGVGGRFESDHPDQTNEKESFRILGRTLFLRLV